MACADRPRRDLTRRAKQAHNAIIPKFPSIPAASDARGKRVFASAGASCHGWSGESPEPPSATLTDTWAVNNPAATNVAQIVISGTKRHTPDGALSMPAFGNAYSDDEIAAVANYVTARFGTKGSTLTANDVAELRKQTAQ